MGKNKAWTFSAAATAANAFFELGFFLDLRAENSTNIRVVSMHNKKNKGNKMTDWEMCDTEFANIFEHIWIWTLKQKCSGNAMPAK